MAEHWGAISSQTAHEPLNMYDAPMEPPLTSLAVLTGYRTSHPDRDSWGFGQEPR